MVMTKTLNEAIQDAAKTLRSFGATEVYLFGSRVTGEDTGESDVDLAVRGLPDEVYYHAIAIASLALPVPLDVISLDDPGPFTNYLLAQGGLQRVA